MLTRHTNLNYWIFLICLSVCLSVCLDLGGHLTSERGSVSHVPHPLTPTNTGQNSPKLRPQRLGFGQGPLKANHDIVGSPAVVADASGNGTASGNAPSGYGSPRSVAVRSIPATPVKGMLGCQRSP